MCCIIRRLLFWLFPFFEGYIVNKNLEEKKSRIYSDTNESYDSFSPKNADKRELKKLYQDEFIRKELLEKKAGTTAVSVTITITLIMGASSFLEEVGPKYNNDFLCILSCVIFYISVCFMLISGAISIGVLTEKSIVYKFQSDKKNKKMKETYRQLIVLNRISNLIRSNSLSACYKTIKYSLILLFITMIIATLPIRDTNNCFSLSSGNSSVSVDRFDIFYSHEVIPYINEMCSFDYIESFVEETKRKYPLKQGKLCVVDEEKKLILKFFFDKSCIQILDIESYIER